VASKAARRRAAKRAARTRKRNAARRSRTRIKIAHAIRTEAGRYPTALLC